MHYGTSQNINLCHFRSLIKFLGLFFGEVWVLLIWFPFTHPEAQCVMYDMKFILREINTFRSILQKFVLLLNEEKLCHELPAARAERVGEISGKQ